MSPKIPAADKTAQITGKHGYPTFAAAKATTRKRNHLKVYRCPFCRQFHVGADHV
jgi:hypothetical protein